jgi:hypothetical protein
MLVFVPFQRRSWSSRVPSKTKSSELLPMFGRRKKQVEIIYRSFSFFKYLETSKKRRKRKSKI